jgi:hypothetical protein
MKKGQKRCMYGIKETSDKIRKKGMKCVALADKTEPGLPWTCICPYERSHASHSSHLTVYFLNGG